MAHDNRSLLVIDSDEAFSRRIEARAEAHGFANVRIAGTTDVETLHAAGPFAVALVALDEGSDEGLRVMARLKAQSPDTEIIVLSAAGRQDCAIASSGLTAFTFLRKPVDLDQLFDAVRAACERRQVRRDHTRLVWELQTINAIHEGIARSRNLQDILTGTLQRVISALGATGGSIRLRDEATGVFELQAVLGPPGLSHMWASPELQAVRPSDRVIATRAAVIVEDLQAIAPEAQRASLPAYSAVGVPLIAGGDLIGTMSLGSDRRRHFGLADQQLLTTIGGQLAVAIQNARLVDCVRRGKREWEATFDAISDPIAVFDGRGELLRGNTALAGHMNRPVTELRGQPQDAVGFCGTAEDDLLAEALAGRQASRREVTTPDGRIFAVSAFPVPDGGSEASVVVSAKDVTEEIRSARRLERMRTELAEANARSTAALERLHSTQAQLLQAEKLSAIGQLVAGVAHELNNPLTTVIGYSQLLRDEFAGREGLEGVSGDLQRIADEAERAARIVRNLLAFARRQTATRSAVQVIDLVERVLALRTYECRLNGIELETRFAPGLPEIIGDGGQLQQALLNLVLNAEQAMRGQPVRRLVVAATHDPASATLHLSVADSGHGIEAANASRIFDPFFTTRDVGQGTGLGLSICYGIVRDHGGEIHVDSTVGEGTTFRIVLPVAEHLPASPILVAHSDDGDRSYLAAMLTGWGYDIVSATTAGEALAAAESPLFALLVDTRLLAADPEGWTALRRRRPHVPLVSVCAAGAVPPDPGGCDGHIVAPYPLSAVYTAVRNVTREYV